MAYDSRKISYDIVDRVIRALCSYFLAWVYNGYKGFSGYNRIQLMMLDDRKVPKWREQKNLPKIKIIAYHIHVEVSPGS